jgi:hypothetical protein
MPMINEAIFALMEGVGTPEAIDTVMKLGMNHPMGPLTLADFIGLDVCLAIMNVLHDGLGDPKYRPCPLLKRMVRGRTVGTEERSAGSTSTEAVYFLVARGAPPPLAPRGSSPRGPLSAPRGARGFADFLYWLAGPHPRLPHPGSHLARSFFPARDLLCHSPIAESAMDAGHGWQDLQRAHPRGESRLQASKLFQ